MDASDSEFLKQLFRENNELRVQFAGAQREVLMNLCCSVDVLLKENRYSIKLYNVII
jgi:hypothetical protein